jgi:DNA-binding transcriptional ArsR family regulator
MTTTRPRRNESSAPRPDPPQLKAVADAKSLDLAFKALANETRRGILALLHDWGGSMSSHDIARRFDVTWQGISRHLRVLTDAGLVVCDVRPNERAYALDREQLRKVPGRWIARVATPGTRTADGRLSFDFTGSAE